MNVVLIGYRGTGKSSVAERVAAGLGYGVASLDREIVARAGMSVPEIVSAQGWPGFRDIEERICREACARERVVIDCGGGVVERPANATALRAAGVVFWLKARVDTIVARIQGDTERPSLTGRGSFTDEVAEVLARRAPLYRAAAHHEVDTDSRTPAEIAGEILAIVGAPRASPGDVP